MSTSDETGLLSISITPTTVDDGQRLDRALQQLIAEDPTIRVGVDRESRAIVLSGTGELQLEVLIDRLKREFNVTASVGRPRVAYREALTMPAEGEMKYANHTIGTDGRKAFAHVKLRLLGAPRGTDYIFVNCISGGSIPPQFVESVETGIKEALARGIVAGYPIGGVKVELYDGSYHDVDSTDDAFEIAGALATIDAAKKAAPVLLEPVMLLEVTVPAGSADEVVRNISLRRGFVDARKDGDGTSVILARAPLAELFGYGTDLRGRTFGRGTFKTRFYRYEPCEVMGGEDDGHDALIGAPLRPKPGLRTSGVALPEPDDFPEVQPERPAT